MRTVVLDYLETYGAMTLRETTDVIQRRHPDITDRQIKDAVGGLTRTGRACVDRDEFGAVYRMAV